MKLVVAEKPSVARDLARVLGVRGRGQHAVEGGDYVITWCVGHLVELDEPAAYDPRWKAWRLDNLPIMPDTFRLRASRHAAAQLRAVAQLLRDRRFTKVINACDAGREGELIFRYVYQYAHARLPVERLWISSLTDDAIGRGFASLRGGVALDPLADAARSRSEADWLVGMNATRAVTARGREAGQTALYSIGRVQTPTLAMLVAREAAIRAFVPRDYWEVKAELRTAAGAAFTAGFRVGPARRLATAALADTIVARDRAQGAAAHPTGPRVERVRSRVVREPPPLLFDLTALQRTANARFGFTAARTLELAQALYERHKILTYPRTDSRHLSSDVVAELPGVFRAVGAVPDYAAFADHLLAHPPAPGPRVVDDGKVHDHHAIIPTAGAIRLDALDRDERRLFDLVVRRFLGAFYPHAELAVTDVWIRVGPAVGAAPAFAPEPDPHRPEGETAAEPPMITALPPEPDRYLARGRVRVSAGWQAVAGFGGEAPRGAGEPAILPALHEGEPLDGAFAPVARQTTPPPRYTEATLLGAMESAGKAIDDEALRAAMRDCGLGTPATRAAVIETLLRRDYIVRDRQHLVPTDMGIALIEALPVASLASPELTGTWERRLARIARGEESRAAFMADIARYVTELVDAIRRAPPPPASAASMRPRSARGRFGKRGRGHRHRTPSASPSRRPRPSKPIAAPGTPTELACPSCRDGSLIAGARGWGCARWKIGCKFVVWFDTAGRRLTLAQLRDLVVRGKTRKARFVSDRGEPVTGRLVLDLAAGARLEPA